MPDKSNISMMRLPAFQAQQTIRARAADEDNITWGTHARQRMAERGIEDIDVIRTLQRGYVDEDPVPSREGEWTCKVTYKLKGNREAGVVTIIMAEGSLFVMTVEWEDLR